MAESQGEVASSVEAEADRAMAGGDRATARRLLEQVTHAEPERLDPWLKLASLCRADQDWTSAMDAVSGALRIDPLGFVPLLLRANLLEAAGRLDEAGEAYGHALAQRPDPIPPHLMATVRQAEQVNSAYVDRMAKALNDAGKPFEHRLSVPERRRLDRFRTNVIRRTRVFHCEPTHFHYPGLVEREFHDREEFPWLEEVEAATPAIAQEFNQLMASERAELVPYIQYPDDQPLRQWKALNWNKAWTAIHLMLNGVVVEQNARHCPATMKILEAVGQPPIPGRSPNAMFSLLAPRTRIPPHNGVSNTRLVCHLPLIVPDRCWFRVGAETREWRIGEGWVFDDTIEHEAANAGDQLRVVLIFDVWHPGLSRAERDAVAAVMTHSAGGAAGL